MKNSLKRNAELHEALRAFTTLEPEFGGMQTAGPLGRVLATLKTMRVNTRQRRELADLSECALEVHTPRQRTDRMGASARRVPGRAAPESA